MYTLKNWNIWINNVDHDFLHRYWWMDFINVLFNQIASKEHWLTWLEKTSLIMSSVNIIYGFETTSFLMLNG